MRMFHFISPAMKISVNKLFFMVKQNFILGLFRFRSHANNFLVVPKYKINKELFEMNSIIR